MKLIIMIIMLVALTACGEVSEADIVRSAAVAEEAVCIIEVAEENCHNVTENVTYVVNVCDDKSAAGYNNETGEYQYCPQDGTLLYHMCKAEEGFSDCLQTETREVSKVVCESRCEK